MIRLFIAQLVALLIAAGFGAFAPAVDTYMPAVRAPPVETPTNTPIPAIGEVAPTFTSTPTVTPTATATATTQPQGPCSCSGNLYNCTNFATHSQAQACFNYCISQGAGDVHDLDRDHDGIACESLPGGFRVLR